MHTRFDLHTLTFIIFRTKQYFINVPSNTDFRHVYKLHIFLVDVYITLYSGTL